MKQMYLLGMISGVLLSQPGVAQSADKVFQLTGRVSRVSAEAVEISSADQRLELPRDSALFRETGVRTGDEVNVWYSVTPRKVEIVSPKSGRGQQPGQVSDPDESPGKVIEDDRLFLDAKNRDPIPPPSHPHS